MLKLFVAIQNRLAELRDEEGQTMAEYGVVLAVITLGIVARWVCSPGVSTMPWRPSWASFSKNKASPRQRSIQR